MELIGNKETFDLIKIATDAAVSEERPVPHMLLCGAAGCGKTSTAKFMAEKSGADFLVIAAAAIKSRQDVIDLIEKLNHSGYTMEGDRVKSVPIKPTIVFIDEIHNLSLKAQEWLGILMEEWIFPLTEKEAVLYAQETEENRRRNTRQAWFKKKKKPKEYKRWSPPFTLVGATTNDGRLSKPFRDRFKLRFNFQVYSLEDSALIALSHAESMGIILNEEGAGEIAKRGRGVPRVIVRLLERCRDVAIMSKSMMADKPIINKEIARLTFSKSGIDDTGLSNTDIQLLRALYEADAPLGIDHLSVKLNESPQVVREAIEPHLIQMGLMVRTGQGRALSADGFKYLIDRAHIRDSVEEFEFVDIPMEAEHKI